MFPGHLLSYMKDFYHLVFSVINSLHFLKASGLPKDSLTARDVISIS